MEKIRKNSPSSSWLAVLLLLVLLSTVFHVAAQSENDVWSTPVNLSHSGAATEPVFVIDATGVVHTFWQDQFAGFMYATGDGVTWNPPHPLELPFSEPPFTNPSSELFGALYKPVVVADPAQFIHALWINSDGILMYSRARLSELTLGSAGWTSPVQLAGSTVVQDVAVTTSGALHVAYIKSQDTPGFPAGVYHRRSDNSGEVWSEPARLYQSAYFRGLTADQANVQITTAGENRIYIAWDNRALDTVFVTHSPDRGQTWEAYQEVDRRKPENLSESAGPWNIQVAAPGESEVHLSWTLGDNQDAQRCRLYHQWSQDGGANWQQPVVTFDDPTGCPASNQFIIGSNSNLFTLVVIREEARLRAWSGEQWSGPELQFPLVRFTNEETFREITLGCRQSAVRADNQLYVVGCGTNAKDIWVTARPLGELADWFDLFEPASAWSTPAVVASSSVHLLPVEVVAGADGRIHAFWSESNEKVTSGRIQQATTDARDDIYYSRLNAGEWSPPRAVLTSPEGTADQIAAAAGTRDSLYVVWSSGKGGGIYFSRAIADRASSTTEWIEPVQLPAPQSTGSWPDILVDRDGTIYVAYSIPLNEDRGVYLVSSNDGGDTWSEPVRVFDGQAAEWQVVGAPHLAVTLNGGMHLVWSRDVTTSSARLAVVYARSEAGGQTWSEPEVVTEETVVWSDIVGIGERTVHRAWLVLSEGRALLWHQHSFDSGLSWSTAVRVSDPSTTGGPAALALDAANHLYLLQLIETNEARLMLQDWVWNGERWQADDTLDLGTEAADANSVTAVTLTDGGVGVIYSTLLLNAETTELQDGLLYTQREQTEQAVEAAPLPTLTPTPPPTATSTPVPEPSPTPTVSFPPIEDEQSGGFSIGPLSANDSIGGIIIGLLPAIAVLVLAVFVSLWLVRSK